MIHANPEDINVLQGPLEAVATESTASLQLLPIRNCSAVICISNPTLAHWMLDSVRS